MKFKITARILHGLSALIIIWATISGLYLAFFELEANTKRQVLEFNVSITFVFIPFFLWRILYRMKNGVPPYNNALTAFEIRMAHYMHKILYVLVLAVLVSGVLMLKEDFQVFKLGYFPHMVDDKQLLDLFSSLHHYLSYLLTICIVIHVLAVIKHEVNGIRIFKRMF